MAGPDLSGAERRAYITVDEPLQIEDLIVWEQVSMRNSQYRVGDYERASVQHPATRTAMPISAS